MNTQPVKICYSFDHVAWKRQTSFEKEKKPKKYVAYFRIGEIKVSSESKISLYSQFVRVESEASIFSMGGKTPFIRMSLDSDAFCWFFSSYIKNKNKNTRQKYI